MAVENLIRLEKILGYSFRNRKWLVEALTHSTFAYDTAQHGSTGCASNERLEFFGDAILHFVISDMIMTMHPRMSEGDMTRLRASLVCEKTLAHISRRLCLDQYIHTGRSLDFKDSPCGDSLPADAMEAVIAAIYMDGGLGEAQTFITRQFDSMVRAGKILVGDFKSRLQELLQKTGSLAVYKIAAQTGPEHGRRFTVVLRIDGRVETEGTGTSIKAAEQQAAERYLSRQSHPGEGSSCI